MWEWVSEWVSGWVGEWVSESVSESVSEWVSEWVTHTIVDFSTQRIVDVQMLFQKHELNFSLKIITDYNHIFFSPYWPLQTDFRPLQVLQSESLFPNLGQSFSSVAIKKSCHQKVFVQQPCESWVQRRKCELYADNVTENSSNLGGSVKMMLMLV